MNPSAPSDPATPGSLSPPLPVSRIWRTRLAETLGRFGCAATLLVAAGAKAHQLFTDPALGTLYGSRWLQVAHIEYELQLGLWLLSGVRLSWARVVALLTFLCFACYALVQIASGATSCGCFGQTSVPQWSILLLDSLIAISLFIWKPTPGKTLVAESTLGRSTPARLIPSVAVLAITGVPLLAIAARPHHHVTANRASFAESDFVLLEPEKWIGQPFPLLDYIIMQERERLARGSWIVVFYRHDCPKCQAALARYAGLANDSKAAREPVEIALIEVPPLGASPPLIREHCHWGRLSDAKEWLIHAPSEIRLMDGRVMAAIENSHILK